MKIKAAWYTTQGAAEKVLNVSELDFPELKPNEVLIRIHTSGINPSDVKRRYDTNRPLHFPVIIPHSDGAGVIEAVGSDVSHDRIKQRVWLYNAQWQRAFGTAATHIIVPNHLAVPLPDAASFIAGACLGIPAMTAHRAVFSDGPVSKQTILVTGGAGNVGRYAIQFAKSGGAKVIATVSNAEKAQYAKEAGADHIINYRDEDVGKRVMDFTAGQGVDRIVEVDFGGNLAVSAAILKINGVIASYASMGNINPALPFYPLMFKGINIRLVNVYELPDTARQQAIKDITTLLATNSLRHITAKNFSLEDIVLAHKMVEANTQIGNVILSC